MASIRVSAVIGHQMDGGGVGGGVALISPVMRDVAIEAT